MGNFVFLYHFQTDHWCAPPANLANLTVETWLNISSPLTAEGGYDRCNVFAVDYGEAEEELMRQEYKSRSSRKTDSL